MTDIKTNCEGCVFAQTQKHHLGTKEGTQIGCSLERHNLLEVEELDDKGNFALKRFCNTYRPEDWIQNLDFDDALNPEETALQEVFPRMGFVVSLNTDNDPGDGSRIESLNKTIESISNAAYVTVTTDKVEYNEGIWEILASRFDDTDTKFHIVQLGRRLEDPIAIIDEAFLHAQNGWMYITENGETVPSNILTRLHEILNIKMRPIMMVEPYDGCNGLMFPAYLFKFLNGNKAKLFQDQTVATGTFIEKIREAEKRGQTKNILTWEEFNAS